MTNTIKYGPFLSKIKIKVQGGDGGRGKSSFFKCTNIHRKPDGGSGGKGGDIIIKGSTQINCFFQYRNCKVFKASNGINGGSNHKNGKKGDDCIIIVPEGSIIFYDGIEVNIDKHNQLIKIADGGRGGIGNGYLSNSRDRFPSHTIEPTIGVEKKLLLSLRIFSHVCLIGWVNSGKSTIFNGLCKKKSDIGNYHFTTKRPILGIINNTKNIIMDLPGLIENSHLGKGLGIDFLEQAIRTKLLCIVINNIDQYKKLWIELNSCKFNYQNKQILIIYNNIDNNPIDKVFFNNIKYDFINIDSSTYNWSEILIQKIEEILNR